jgi:hypothetical protein
MSTLLPVCVYAVNPFLDAPDDKPLSAKFRGTEWGDEILCVYDASHPPGHFLEDHLEKRRWIS